jgi:hypothetical protein
MPVTVRLDDIVEALEMLVDESPSYLDLDTGQVVSVSEDLLSEAEEPATKSRIFQTGRKTNGRSQNELCQRTAFWSFRRRFICMNGGSCRSFHARWSPMLYARIFYAPSTAPGPSGISRTLFVDMASNHPGMHSGRRP